MNTEKVRELCTLYKQLSSSGVTKERLSECYNILIELTRKSWIQKALGGKKKFEAFKYIVESLRELVQLLSELDEVCRES